MINYVGKSEKEGGDVIRCSRSAVATIELVWEGGSFACQHHLDLKGFKVACVTEDQCG